MVKIVWYLPTNKDYADRLRKEFVVDDPSQIEQTRLDYLNAYASPSQDKSGRFVGGDDSGTKTYEWNSSTKDSILYYQIGKFSKGKIYDDEKDEFIVNLKRNQGLSYKQVANRFNEVFDEDKSWVAIRDRLARLEDRK